MPGGICLIGLIGAEIGASLSPALHDAGFAAMTESFAALLKATA